ncbi:MAG TPA: hypothetical protein DCM05_03215 [Elusimicrobia bacterium]|nr:hypothetical protein [Elusimicrobiota bacterium]
MNGQDKVKDVIRWARGTDLAEVAYQRDGENVEFRLEGAPPALPPMPACSLIPGRSPTVGLFRASALGSAAKLEQGRQVSEGELLGHVEIGVKNEPVKAPASGKLVSVLIEDGHPVQYGQALFFVQP